jgi:hypothetical protein
MLLFLLSFSIFFVPFLLQYDYAST